MTNQERIAEIEAKLAELEARLPKHSVPPTMIIELEELEDELEMLKTTESRDATRS